MDDRVVVVDELAETEHVAVVVHETVHVTEPHVSHAVVDLEEAEAVRHRGRTRDGPIAGQERAPVGAPLDE